MQRPGHQLSSGGDHQRIAGVDPVFGGGIQTLPFREIIRQVAIAQGNAGTDHPAASFPGDMPAGADPAFSAVVAGRDMDVHALGVQREAGQGHVVLPAQQRADAAHGGFGHPQSRAVAEPPDHALGIGRHQLAVMVENAAIGADHHQAVVERGAAHAAVTLVDPHYHGHPGSGRGLAHRGEFVRVQIDRVVQQPLVQNLTQIPVTTRPQTPHPGRVARHEGFGKDDQFGPLGGGFADQLHRPVEGFFRSRTIGAC